MFVRLYKNNTKTILFYSRSWSPWERFLTERVKILQDQLLFRFGLLVLSSSCILFLFKPWGQLSPALVSIRLDSCLGFFELLDSICWSLFRFDSFGLSPLRLGSLLLSSLIKETLILFLVTSQLWTFTDSWALKYQKEKEQSREITWSHVSLRTAYPTVMTS